MHPILRNILAFVAGLILGGAVNMGVLMLGMVVLPPPPGVDIMDIASINEHIHEYSFVAMMVPFLAHALGTLVGAFVVVRIAASQHLFLAMGIGIIFLFGGIDAVRQIPNAPVWFDVLDLVVAYLPMAWLGHRMANREVR
jgi:hypothetical protein